jgi:hypothetical protein
MMNVFSRIFVAVLLLFSAAPGFAAGYTTQADKEIIENVDATDKDEAGEMDKELEEEAEDDQATGEDA